MLHYEYFQFFKHYAWRLVDDRKDKKRVIANSVQKHDSARSCVAEIEFVRGKNTDIPIVLITKEPR